MCVAFAKRSPVRVALGVAALLSVATLASVNGAQLLAVHRTFFGVHRVFRSGDARFNELYHGTTLHGRQLIAGTTDVPLTYYHHNGPLGTLFAALPALRRRRVGVIGLGVGSIAAYAGDEDRYTFFEIDPAVRSVAEDSGYFNFLSNARKRGAAVNVVLGDARLTLNEVPGGTMNLVVLDAFSGDAIPLHLLTREALAMYLDKLDEHGLVAVHISNLYLDLEPVVAGLARDAGCVALCREDLELTPTDWAQGKTASKWVLIARRPADLPTCRDQAKWQPARLRESARVWTDDYSNVLSTLR
jgi:spermidine synthase